MSVERQRDFQNFELGDNVYELADGLVPQIAEKLDFELGDMPDNQEMHKLVGVLGKNKVLRENEEVTAIEIEEAADLVERSGVQQSLNRSLWTPNLEIGDLGYSGFTVINGGVANWQDRTANLVAEDVSADTLSKDVRVVTGNRLMGKTASEANNSNISRFYEEEGRMPTEAEYAARFVLPVLEEAGAVPVLTSYDTASGEELANNFSRNTKNYKDGDKTRHEKIFTSGSPVTFARVANAGVQLAIQYRQAIRDNVDPDFDSSDLPDVFIRTDSFPVARTDEQKNDPANFQSPYTALRQVVLTAKMLHEASTA